MQKDSNIERVLWLGLESYSESDHDIFYGRSVEIARLSAVIFNSAQTVIYGPSGTGKTSLIRAGIFREARSHGFMPVYVRLNHDPKQGAAKNYTDQIIEAVKREAEASGVEIDQTVPYIAADGRCGSLWEFFHCNEFWNGDNYPVTPLVVIDQFEEIFTLGKEHKLQPDFFTQLSDLCDDKYPLYVREYLANRGKESLYYPETVRFRIVMSLREDFLARLEEHASEIPALKRNRHSLQSLNNLQAMEIITKPQPGLVSRDEAVMIIEKVTNKRYGSDFSFDEGNTIDVEPAILSIFCHELDKRRRERGLDTITRELIDEFGDNIIKDFYLNTLAPLSEAKIDYLERALLTDDGFRDAAALTNVKRAGLSDADIKYLTDNRLVRIEKWDGAERMEFAHDVLCKVAMEHRTERESAREREDERRRLEAEAEAAREKLAKRNRRWAIIVAILVVMIIAPAIVILTGFFGTVKVSYLSYELKNGWPVGVGRMLSDNERAQSPLYYTLTKPGWFYKNYQTVVVRSSNPRLPLDPRIADPAVDLDGSDASAAATAFIDKLKLVERIDFIGDKKGKATKEIYYGPNDSILFVKNNTFLSDGVGAWSNYVNPDGSAMPVNGRGVDRMRYTLYPDGRVETMTYVDSRNATQAGGYGVAKYLYRYNDDTTRIYLQDIYGRMLQPTVTGIAWDWNPDYNMMEKVSNSNVNIVSYRRVADIDDLVGEEAIGPRGYHREERWAKRQREEITETIKEEIEKTKRERGVVVDSTGVTKTIDAMDDCAGRLYYLGDSLYRWIRADERGNVVEERTAGKRNLIFRPDISLYEYDPATGYKTEEKHLTISGRPYRDVYLKRWGYSDGKLVSETHIDASNSEVYRHTLTNNGVCQIDSLFDAAAERQLVVTVDSILSDGYRVKTFFDAAGQPIAMKRHGVGDSLYYRVKYKRTPEVADSSFYTLVDDRMVEASPIFHKVDSFDQSGLLRRSIAFNPEGKIEKSMGYFVEDGRIVARAVIGIDGYPVRCPRWENEGLTYYKVYYTLSDDHAFQSILPVNEEDLKSVFMAGDDYYAVSVPNYRGRKIVDGPMINRDYYQSEFSLESEGNLSDMRVPYLHILDRESPLYKAGFRDGDRILVLGRWSLGDPDELLASEWREARGSRKYLMVWQENPYNNDFKEAEVTVSSDGSGEEYHVVKCTVDESILYNYYNSRPHK